MQSSDVERNNTIASGNGGGIGAGGDGGVSASFQSGEAPLAAAEGQHQRGGAEVGSAASAKPTPASHI